MKTRKIKRLISCVLTAIILLTMLPMTAVAADTEYNVTVNIIGGVNTGDQSTDGYMQFKYGSDSSKRAYHGGTITLPAGSANVSIMAQQSNGDFNYSIAGLYLLTGSDSLTPNTAFSVSSDFGTPELVINYPFTMPASDVTIWVFFKPENDENAAPYILTETLPAGTTDAAYSASVSAIGDTSFTWSATGLPDGLSIDAGTGAISGTPTVAGDHSVTVTASGKNTLVAGSKTFTLSTAASLETHSHPVCGASHSDIGDHSGDCESIQWTAWDGSDKDTETEGRQLTAGSYYLTKDITVDSAVITRGAVSLCLNGHSITLDEEAQNSVLIVGDDTDTTSDELNLCDCNGSSGSHTITDPTDADGAPLTIIGGLITGGSGKPSGSSASYGGGVYTQPGAGFNMYGGTIAGNTSEENRYLQGGGVYASNSGDESFNLYGGAIINNAATSTFGGGGVYLHYSDFNMYGGTIADNTSDNEGGGVYAWSGSNLNITGGKISGNAAYTATGGGVYFDGSSFKLSGAPKITDNTSGTNKYGNTPRTDNVYLAESKVITVNGAMTDGASVGISMEAPGIFAEPDGTTVTDLTDYIAYFSDDNTTDDYGIDTDTAGNLALSEIIYPISINGIGLNDGEYLASRGTEAVTTKPEGEDGYAHYSNGILTLSDFFFGGYNYSGVVHPGPLTVKLIGESYLNFDGYAFDLCMDDGSAGDIMFVNADTTDGYGTLDVDATMLVYYSDNVSPGNITVGENTRVYSFAGIHADDLTVEGSLQSGDQIVLSGKLTRGGDAEIYAEDYYYGAIEWSCGANEPVSFNPANYLDLGTDGKAFDEDGKALVLGYYYDSELEEYLITFFGKDAEWTQENAVDYVELLLSPFAVADIYIGGVGLSDGEYLANSADAATTTAPASGGYAYYANGVLTLSDFTLEGDADYCAVEHEGSLTVKLLGDSTLGFYEYGFVLSSDSSSTPSIEFISGDSDEGTLEVSAYQLVDNDSYKYRSNVTIGEITTLILDADLYADQLTVNGTLEIYQWTCLEGKLIRGENGTVRAEFDGEYGAIEWWVGTDEPSDFNTSDYLELNGGEAVDEDGNALVLGYYFDEDYNQYYGTFFEPGLSESEWKVANAEKSVILQSKTDAGETDPPVVNPPVVNPPTPPTDSVTIPISGEENSIEVDASVSGSKATVDEVDLSELDTVIGEEVSVGTVTIDFSGLNQDIDTVEIPSNVVKQIAEAVNDPNNDAESLEVVLSDGTSIEFDAVALGEKAAQAGGLDITISIENSVKATLTAAQQNAVGSNTAYDINVTSGGKHISDMGGMVTVHAPYELKSGEVPHGVVVYYVDDSGNKEACETSYDSVRKRVNWKTDHLSLYMIGYDEERAASCPKDETCPMYPFEDVSVNAWYHDGVHYAIENGLMQGTSTTKKLFSPGGATTRAQIVTILWRMEGEPICGQGKSGTFGDVPDYQWYTEAVEWAAAYGIVEGYGDAQQSFAPNEPITREQLAAILWRYAKYKGYDVSVGESTNILSFEDASAVSEYAVPAMQWAYGAGIIQGVGSANSGVRLDPKGSAIRSQAATIMMRFCENITP